MKSLIKAAILVLMILLFAGDKRNGEVLRYFGEKTGYGACYNAADLADCVQEEVDSLFEGLEDLATEQVHTWKDLALPDSNA